MKTLLMDAEDLKLRLPHSQGKLFPYWVISPALNVFNTQIIQVKPWYFQKPILAGVYFLEWEAGAQL